MDGLKILSISGWTQPADFLHHVIPQAVFYDYGNHRSMDAIIDDIPKGEIDLLVGWSLGGIIARELVRQHIIKPKALVLLSSPYQFVRCDSVNAAMPKETFDVFYQNYREETARTVARFDALMAKGDANAKGVMQQMRHHGYVMDTEQWLPWMDFLETYSASHHDYSMLPKTLIMHGANDTIVPYEQSLLLHEHIKDSHHIGWDHAAHALHLHDAQQLRAHIEDFVRDAI